MRYKVWFPTFGDPNTPNQVGAPSTDAVQLTPADLRLDGVIKGTPRCVYVCVAGNIDWEGLNENNRRTTPVFAGAILPFIPKKIYSANTTATIELWY